MSFTRRTAILHDSEMLERGIALALDVFVPWLGACIYHLSVFLCRLDGLIDTTIDDPFFPNKRLPKLRQERPPDELEGQTPDRRKERLPGQLGPPRHA